MSAILFSKDGESIIVAISRPGIEGVVDRWELKSAQRKLHLKVHNDQILSLKISRDGRTIATASYDKSIALIDYESGKPTGRLMEHTDAVYDIAFDPGNANRLASVSADRTLKIWDLTTKKRLDTLSESTAEQYCVEFSGNGKFVFAAGVDRTIRGWDVTAQPVKLVSSALAHESPVNKIAKIDSENAMEEILSFSEDLTSKRWNMATLSPLANGLKLEDWATSVASTKDIVAIATFHGGISVYKWGKVPSLLWQKKPGNLQAGSPESLKPQLFRNSVLGTPSPRVVTSGQENEVTLSAAGIENAMKISIFPDDIKVITSKSTKPNSLTLRLNIPKRNHFDIARIKVATPFGITLEQPIGILPDSSTIIKSDSTKVKTITTASRQVIQATIEKAGEVARLKITPEKGKSF
ncbi:MAG: WD40 repeat domain-containing protein, partial [bacterium]